MTPELCHCIYRNQGYVYAVTPYTRCAECQPENRQPFTAENVNRAFEELRAESAISPSVAAAQIELAFLMMPWLEHREVKHE